MKKLISLALILSVIAGMASCAGTPPISDATDTTTSDITETDTAAPETDYVPEWGDFKINESDPKTVAEQRRDISTAMNDAMNTKVVWTEANSFAPIMENYAHISAITYDGLTLNGDRTKVFAYLGFPSGASSETPAPAVILVHGEDGHPFLDWVKKWNERGYVAIAIDVTGYFPKARNSGLNERFSSQFTYGLSEKFAESGYVNAPDHSYAEEYTEVGEQWMYHAIGQIIKANTLLRQCDRIDSDRIGIVGISRGAVLATQAIGYDNRFAFAIPIYGAAYLDGELRTYESFWNEYVSALWAPERNLNNATMPILWCVNNDDPIFGMSSYVNSYYHTAGLNGKTTLSIMADCRNKHASAIKSELPYLFADYITGKGGEWITFETEQLDREVECKLNIPEAITGDITATVYYLTKEMAYKTYDKYGYGENEYLDEEWKTSDFLTVDRAASTVSGSVPEDVYGYYISLKFNVGETPCEISSAYTEIK